MSVTGAVFPDGIWLWTVEGTGKTVSHGNRVSSQRPWKKYIQTGATNNLAPNLFRQMPNDFEKSSSREIFIKIVIKDLTTP